MKDDDGIRWSEQFDILEDLIDDAIKEAESYPAHGGHTSSGSTGFRWVLGSLKAAKRKLITAREAHLIAEEERQ
jgi:hypothetical protein